MLYKFLKIFASIGIHIFCRNIRINNKAFLQINGPVLLAVNHPNSFLDAIILAILFKQPVYSLARGDAFKYKPIAFILNSLHILPVYREREGAENLHLNYVTFDNCNQLLKKNALVLIFTEALSENEWHLRPLKKGTARIAITAWQQDIALKILPMGINYSSFKLFGKNVHINMGNFIEQHNFNALNNDESGKNLIAVTNAIQQQLQTLVYEIDKNDATKLASYFKIKVSTFKKMALIIPALLGYFLHFPLYFTVQKIIEKTASTTSHYDSILIVALSFLYPFYLIIIALIFNYFAQGYWWIAAFVLPPFCAWSYVQLKMQIAV